MSINRTFLHRLRVFAIIEGISTLVLFFIAMPLKYLAGYPLAVTIAGSIHGWLFVGLVILFLVAIRKVPISRNLALGGIFGAVVPFGPFVVDRWLAKLAEGGAPE